MITTEAVLMATVLAFVLLLAIMVIAAAKVLQVAIENAPKLFPTLAAEPQPKTVPAEPPKPVPAEQPAKRPKPAGPPYDHRGETRGRDEDTDELALGDT